MGKLSRISLTLIFVFLGTLAGLFFAWIYYYFSWLVLIFEIACPVSGGFLIYFIVRDLKKVSMSKGTHIFFILLLVSISALFYGVIDMFYFWFFIGEILLLTGLISAIITSVVFSILLVLDRKKAIKTGEIVVKTNKYSLGTKVFFWVFIGCIVLLITGFVTELYFWSGFVLLALGSYGAVISGIILFILFLRDRSRPKMRGPVYPSSPIQPISIAELKNIIGISSKILIQDLANAIQTNRANLLKFIADNRIQLPPIQIEGEYLVIHPEKIEWVCQVCGFTNYGSKTSCSECKSPYSK